MKSRYSKPDRNQVIASGQDQFKGSLFDKRTGDKIEVRDDREDLNASANKTQGVTFFKGLNSVFDG